MPLVFAPESGNMLGGTVVNITGPCFNESQKIKCRFENEVVMGTVINKNRAICVQPFLKYEGYIRFYIAIDSGSYDWKGKYFVGKISFTSRSLLFNTDASLRLYLIICDNEIEIYISGIHKIAIDTSARRNPGNGDREDFLPRQRGRSLEGSCRNKNHMERV